jgi:2-dehydro-3-deoxyphosphooctonate aldolase (KDO 8-P synthase)
MATKLNENIAESIFEKKQFFLIAGPCVVESEEISLEIAQEVQRICATLGIYFIFKASYKKANRTKLDSFSGIGDVEALEILKKVRDTFNVPVLTDVHAAADVDFVAQYVDVLQIPAFLSRQTDLLVATGKSGLPVNIKKGQFLNAISMEHALEKVVCTGNNQVILTERGNSFGYGDLVVDFRNIPIMQQFGFPVVLDATHAVQQPNQQNGISGGTPHFIKTLVNAGMAAGVDGLFLETHPNPAEGLSDSTNMLKLSEMEAILRTAMRIRECLK